MMPLPPFYQTWGGGRGDQTSALDMLNTSVRRSLSEGAQRALSMIPTTMTQLPENVSGQYFGAGRSPGYTQMNASYNPDTKRDRFWMEVMLHEGLHGFDAAFGRKPSRSLVQMPRGHGRISDTASVAPTRLGRQETARQYGRYHGRAPTPGQTLNTSETYATTGMSGPESIPPDLLPYFADFFSKDAIRRAKWNYSHGR